MHLLYHPCQSKGGRAANAGLLTGQRVLRTESTFLAIIPIRVWECRTDAPTLTRSTEFQKSGVSVDQHDREVSIQFPMC